MSAISYRNDRWINQTGLNLIRVVIGSYFMAVSLGLVQGLDPRALFLPILSAQHADLVGSTLLFFLTVVFMTGVFLRLSSLGLALFVLVSSVVQTFTQFELSSVSDFWRDLTLACAVMLNYSALKRHEMRLASILANQSRRQQLRKKIKEGDAVTPRRVTLDDKPGRPTQNDIRRALLGAPQFPNRSLSFEADMTDEDPVNIFANV